MGKKQAWQTCKVHHEHITL